MTVWKLPQRSTKQLIQPLKTVIEQFVKTPITSLRKSMAILSNALLGTKPRWWRHDRIGHPCGGDRKSISNIKNKPSCAGLIFDIWFLIFDGDHEPLIIATQHHQPLSLGTGKFKNKAMWPNRLRPRVCRSSLHSAAHWSERHEENILEYIPKDITLMTNTSGARMPNSYSNCPFSARVRLRQLD